MRRRSSTSAAGFAVCALLAVGCGDSSEPTATATTPTATATTDAPDVPAGDADLVDAARRHAQRRLGISSSANEVTLVRSERDPRWALAAGASGRDLWAIWLRDGKVRLAETEAARFDPPAVPCDLRPAFSEPHC